MNWIMVECLPVVSWTLGKILVRLCSKTERVKGFMASEKAYFPRLCNITSKHNKYHRDKQQLHMSPPLLPRQLDRWAMIRSPCSRCWVWGTRERSLAWGPQLERTLGRDRVMACQVAFLLHYSPPWLTVWFSKLRNVSWVWKTLT